MKKTLLEEKNYLSKIIEKIDEISLDYKERIEILPKVYKNDPFLLSNLFHQYTSKLKLIKKIKEKPYFARIDFKNKEDEKEEECYISKVGLLDNDSKIVTVDWRAPISSIYYDSNIGKTSYEAPEGVVFGELLLKRQYEIENKILKNFNDVDTVSNDEILKPYLTVNAESRLKNIVASIQSEQNEIIREKFNKNLIIQGVAGSGKTTVALHRVAYLVYNYIKDIKPEEYLVIGPNKFFVNYISGVLPDLDVNNISQLTFEEVVKNLLKEKFTLITDENYLIKYIEKSEDLIFQRFKTSTDIKVWLDKYLLKVNNNVIPEYDFCINNYTILSRLVIEKFYNDEELLKYEILSKKIDRVILLISRYIEEKTERILLSIRNQFYKKIEGISKEEVEIERKKYNLTIKEIQNKCTSSLKKYFSNAFPKIFNLYFNFLEEINKQDNFTNYDIQNTINNIKKRMVEFEDLGILLYLYYKIYGSGEFSSMRHVVIDEAQDLGEFNFYVLKKIFSKATFSIFGDIAQSIYNYRSFENWEKIIKATFNNLCDIKYLKKSYRTTVEIMNSANNITRYLNLDTANPVIRHGEKVKYIKLNSNLIEKLKNIIKEYENKKYLSIAIICKDEKESKLIYKELMNNDIKVTNITNTSLEYNSGICVVPSYLSKGLEFDSVIIVNANENIYNSKKIVDMKLLYVAFTRALHELTVLYNDNITYPLKDEIK